MVLEEDINTKQNNQFDYFYQALKNIEDNDLTQARNNINLFNRDFILNNISVKNTVIFKASLVNNIDFFEFCCDKIIDSNLANDNRFWLSVAMASLQNKDRSLDIFRHITNNKLSDLSQLNLGSFERSLKQVIDLNYKIEDQKFIESKIESIKESLQNPNNSVSNPDSTSLNRKQQDKDKTL